MAIVIFLHVFSPENVSRLFDLIKFSDDRFKTAFYFALRDTLVSSDLDQGTRIAYGAKRYRVVTLVGDMIETTGMCIMCSPILKYTLWVLLIILIFTKLIAHSHG